MELLTILLSGLLGLVSPVGFVVDRTVENAVRSQFQSVEQLQVRVDNAPSYQIVQGKVNRLQIAGRGVFPIQELRIAALDLETDAIDIDPNSLGQQGPPKFRKPLQAAVRLVLRQEDINKALQSPTLTARLRNLAINLPNVSQAQQIQRYDFLNPRVEFLDSDRIRFQIELVEQGRPDKLTIKAESAIQVVAGREIRLIEPVVQVNGEAVPDEIVASTAKGISQQLDLRNLENAGFMVRLLKLQITPAQQVEIATFVRAEPNQQ